MPKKQLKDLFTKPQRFRIPIPILRCKLKILVRPGEPIYLYL